MILPLNHLDWADIESPSSLYQLPLATTTASWWMASASVPSSRGRWHAIHSPTRSGSTSSADWPHFWAVRLVASATFRPACQSSPPPPRCLPPFPPFFLLWSLPSLSQRPGQASRRPSALVTCRWRMRGRELPRFKLGGPPCPKLSPGTAG